MSLQTAMQRRSRQVGDRRLQSVKAIVQWQQCMAPECNDHCLLSLGQHGRSRLRRPRLHILDRRALAPLRNGLGIDTQLTAQLRERSLRSLYCCSDSVRGRGAAMTNLSQRASFHSRERIAPSNRGIKHLSWLGQFSVTSNKHGYKQYRGCLGGTPPGLVPAPMRGGRRSRFSMASRRFKTCAAFATVCLPMSASRVSPRHCFIAWPGSPASGEVLRLSTIATTGAPPATPIHPPRGRA